MLNMLKMPKILKTLKMLNNKINKNRNICIANGNLEQIYSLKRTFL